jgi:hypothetical protein
VALLHVSTDRLSARMGYAPAETDEQKSS